MKSPFKSFTIAVTGDFGQNRTVEMMRRWIQANGGSFAYEITPQVTHLICSKDNYNKNVNMVKAARKYGNAEIVTFDWLEDSLMQKRPLDEKHFLLEKVSSFKKERKIRKNVTRQRNIQKGLEDFEKSCKEFQQEMQSSADPYGQVLSTMLFSNAVPDGYHIYVDHTNYIYDITLTRANLLTNHNERHMLKLYETNSIPKQYACFEKHSAPGQAPKASPLAPVGSSWGVAFDHFKKFFRLKTGIDWDRRLEAWDTRDHLFKFVRPKEEEPKGVLISDYTDEGS